MRTLRQHYASFGEQDNKGFPDFIPTSEMLGILKGFISDLPHPVLIINRYSKEIYTSNKAAELIAGQTGLEGQFLDDAVDVMDIDIFGEELVNFGSQWFNLRETEFSFKEYSFLRIDLLPRKDIPSADTLETWKKMIAVMLHRLRSPLSGVRGYLELLQDEDETESTQHRAAAIQSGVDRVFNMLDELEHLYIIDSNFGTASSEPVKANLHSILDKILIHYPEEIKNNVVRPQKTQLDEIECDPVNLYRVLDLLMQNAIEHSAGNVTVTMHSSRCIQISNEGSPIPAEISRNLFDPFVTTKANNLGIGLTMALLYARQAGGTIFLSSNSSENDISFTVYFS